MMACSGSEPDRPDLFLITVDAVATDRLSCFGGAPDSAPSICALAQGGLIVPWAVADAWGEASAAATVLSGRSPRDHGVGDQGARFLSERIPTLAERLSRAGYATAAFVASPRLNRSRRLDQGFMLYEDRLPKDGRSEPAALARRVGDWLERHPPPRFVWIHASRSNGIPALDRLIAGLDRTLHPESSPAPGVVFLSLRGEAPDSAAWTPDSPGDHLGEALSWRRHRVPMIWRAPGTLDTQDAAPVRTTTGLFTLADVPATLLSAAGLPPESPVAGLPPFEGLVIGDMQARTRGFEEEDSNVRRILLSSRPLVRRTPDLEVGLATPDVFYVRKASPLDESGRPLSTQALREEQARFARIPSPNEDANLEAGGEAPVWRRDVLGASSPVPALEFHLARALRAVTHPTEEAP
jgi:hypothetical protein